LISTMQNLKRFLFLLEIRKLDALKMKIGQRQEMCTHRALKLTIIVMLLNYFEY